MGPKSDQTECRFASETDFDQVTEVWWESSRSADGAPAQQPSVDELRARVSVEIEAGWNLAVAVAARSGRIIGFLSVKPSDAILDQLYILPAEQRTGVGRALLCLAKKEMRAGFTLRTASANVRARQFYEKAELTGVAEGLHPRDGLPVSMGGRPLTVDQG